MLTKYYCPLYFTFLFLSCAAQFESSGDDLTDLQPSIERVLRSLNQEDEYEGAPSNDFETMSSKNLFKQAELALSEKDFAKTQKLLEEAAARDDDEPIRVRSLVLLAEKIMIGQYGNYKKAMELLELAEMSDAAPEYKVKVWKMLACAHEEGLGVGRDLRIAAKFYEKLARQKCDLLAKADAHYRLGLIYDGYEPDLINPDLALKHLKEVLTQQDDKKLHAYTWYKMSEMAIHGCGPLKKDFDLVVGFLQKAVEQNDEPRVRARALLRLGTLYRGVLKSMPSKIDYVRAFNYYQQAALQKDDLYVCADACELLAHMLVKGYAGVEVNTSKALEYLEMIVHKKLGIVDQQVRACLMLGDMYRQGAFGIEKDEAKAASYYKKAAGFKEKVLIGDESIEQRLKWVRNPKAVPEVPTYTPDTLF